ncbi:DUF2516 family protein [Streptomyces lusitanus]|uniref:DUF2516 family protein n=1 Tax=Streptomyces lusitanus TaxID=68232 RepID=UPI003638E350
MGGLGQVLAFDFLNPFWWLAVGILVQAGRAARRREPAGDAYRAADKKSKPFWLIIWHRVRLRPAVRGELPVQLPDARRLVAAIVYMVDVRPAIKQLTDGRGGNNKRNTGPYGPW